MIELHEGGMRICFRVNENKTVDLADFSAAENGADMPPLDSGPSKTRQFLAAHVTGESASSCHAGKHDAGSVAQAWLYQGHEIIANDAGRELRMSLRAPDGLSAIYHMQLYTGLPIVRTWAEITNNSQSDLGLEYVSSFMYGGIGKNRIRSNYDHITFYLPHNGWYHEAQWQKCTAVDVGLSHIATEGHNVPDRGFSRFHYGSNDSWSTSEYLPIAIARDDDSGEVYYGQIDHSGAWEIEYGMGDGQNLYLCLLGPNNDSAWWKNLQPGATFTTVPAAFGVCLGDVNEAVAALTRYRRAIRRPNQDDEHCNVVFNDYMNCLFGDPTEAKEKTIIDHAAALGCEYFCLDCGWYDSGAWWDRVGEWKESPERFPHGLKAVYDYARGKGLRMGMWLEIEAMGTECALAKTLPDDWFVTTHGKRRIENKRYLLDFRNPAVRKHCSDVVDRLIADYGCEFFKIDYNVTTGPGSDRNADSMGDAMLEHYRALYDWIRSVYEKHPNLIIENCGSGAMRMDYGMLALHSLQSTSDQTDFISNAYIAANVASAVTPEQGGVWVYPYEDDREHVIFNMVNGILLRPYLSGAIWNMSDESMAVLREGIATYKAIRGDLKGMVPFFPRGFNRVNDAELAYGIRDDKKAYLAVYTIHGNTADIPLTCLKQAPRLVKERYPASADCEYQLTGDRLHVTMPASPCARLFEIELA